MYFMPLNCTCLKRLKWDQAWWHKFIIPGASEGQAGEFQVQGKVGKTLSQKQNTNKRAGYMAQVVEFLRLGSVPSTTKKRGGIKMVIF
jgi:hypothetical protein